MKEESKLTAIINVFWHRDLASAFRDCADLC